MNSKLGLLLWLVSGFGTWQLLAWLRGNKNWVEENYSREFYPHVRRTLEGAFHWAPFSVAEPLAAIGLALVVCWWVRFVWRAVAPTRPGEISRWRHLTAGALGGAWAGLFLLWTYFALWGTNQFRTPLLDRPVSVWGAAPGGMKSDASAEAIHSPAAFREFARELTLALIEDADLAGSDGFALFDGDGELLPAREQDIQRALNRLAKEMPEFAGDVPGLRPFGGPAWFARFGISGLFVPFTGEPHLNAEGPGCRWPFRALHEIAHQRGYAREDEANFLGWWMAIASGNKHFRYSANLVAWSYCQRTLWRIDRELATELYAQIPAGIRDDMQAVSAYWKQFEGPLERVGTKTNDMFLKSQGQTAGVESYGRMLDLLLAYRHANGLHWASRFTR